MWTTSTGRTATWLSIGVLASSVFASPAALPVRGHRFSLNTVRNSKFTANGPAAKAKALAKYAHLVADNDLVNIAATDGLITGFAEADDREWLCPVKIGTPPQTVYLDIDTGSADLWVFTPVGSNSHADLGDRSVYYPTNSSTSELIQHGSWSISYGDGSYAGGKVYTDTVTIGGLKIPNATVEAALSYSTNLVADDAPLSGLMGLAINLSTTCEPDTMPNILHLLGAQGVDHIAVDLQYHANGTYNFGNLSASAYTGPMSYQPVTANKGYWWIELTTMRMGNNNQTRLHSWDIIVDTGTSLFLAPSDVVDAYYELVPSSKYSTSDGAYIFHCNETLPDFHFGFADDWSEFTVPGKFMNYSTAPTAGHPWCYGGIQESNMGFSIMGDVFLKAVYVDFNVANQSIGFASKPIRF